MDMGPLIVLLVGLILIATGAEGLKSKRRNPLVDFLLIGVGVFVCLVAGGVVT